MRAVLDPNILIAALLSPSGTPAELVSRWLAGDFELVVSEALLAELDRAFGSPRLSERIRSDEAADFVALLRSSATCAPDAPTIVRRSADPGDDYLLTLAESEHAVLVSGDRHLLALANELPIRTARTFLDGLGDT